MTIQEQLAEARAEVERLERLLTEIELHGHVVGLNYNVLEIEMHSVDPELFYHLVQTGQRVKVIVL